MKLNCFSKLRMFTTKYNGDKQIINYIKKILHYDTSNCQIIASHS